MATQAWPWHPAIVHTDPYGSYDRRGGSLNFPLFFEFFVFSVSISTVLRARNFHGLADLRRKIENLFSRFARSLPNEHLRQLTVPRAQTTYPTW